MIYWIAILYRHYHSMHVFASYDLVDEHHNRVAQGHKASFCLEDVQCKPGVEKKFHCTGFGDKGTPSYIYIYIYIYIILIYKRYVLNWHN